MPAPKSMACQGATADAQERNNAIRAELEAQAESDYASFSASLSPGTLPMLGVRIPKLRAMAARLAAGADWRSYLSTASNGTFEEVLLQGLTIGAATAKAGGKGQPTLAEAERLVAGYVTKITGWSLCDSFCCSLKVAKRQPAAVWEWLQPYLRSSKENELRYGVVMLLFHFVDSGHIEADLQLLGAIHSEAYYVRMAVAWALSVCYIKFRQPTMALLGSGQLDDDTLNKALQKCIESYRVAPADKQQLRLMKCHKRQI